MNTHMIEVRWGEEDSRYGFSAQLIYNGLILYSHVSRDRNYLRACLCEALSRWLEGIGK